MMMMMMVVISTAIVVMMRKVKLIATRILLRTKHWSAEDYTESAGARNPAEVLGLCLAEVVGLCRAARAMPCGGTMNE